MSEQMEEWMARIGEEKRVKVGRGGVPINTAYALEKRKLIRIEKEPIEKPLYAFTLKRGLFAYPYWIKKESN